jgi:hypothetical protein
MGRSSCAREVQLPVLSSSLVLLALAFLGNADAKQLRDSKAIREFKRENPCPSNGKKRGACPGYVIDQVIPLCANGPDKPLNMQWQTRADAKVTDREELRQCAALRRAQ